MGKDESSSHVRVILPTHNSCIGYQQVSMRLEVGTVGWMYLLHFRNVTNDFSQTVHPTTLIVDQWVFISVFVNPLTSTQHGIRYYLNETSHSESVIYQSRNTSASYKVSSTTHVFWGGDGRYSTCNCYLQYLRVYLNWVADSQDQLINLALMDADGTFMQNQSI